MLFFNGMPDEISWAGSVAKTIHDGDEEISFRLRRAGRILNELSPRPTPRTWHSFRNKVTIQLLGMEDGYLSSKLPKTVAERPALAKSR
jgi:hypothetical protein